MAPPAWTWRSVRVVEGPLPAARPADCHSAASGQGLSEGSPSPSSGFGPPTATTSMPSGPASKARSTSGATRITSHWRTSLISSSSRTRPDPLTTTYASSCSRCWCDIGLRTFAPYRNRLTPTSRDSMCLRLIRTSRPSRRPAPVSSTSKRLMIVQSLTSATVPKAIPRPDAHGGAELRSPPSELLAAGLDQSGLVGEQDRLHAVAELELRQECRDVRLDGRFADDVLGGDLGVRQAAGDEQERFALACGQLVEAGRHRRVLDGRELLDHPPRDCGGEQRVAGGDRAQPRDELRAGHVFEEEAAGARAQCLVDVLVAVEGGQHEHARRVLAGVREKLARRGEAVEVRHYSPIPAAAT